MNEEIYEGTPAKEDVLIGTDSGYNRYRRPDGSTYVHYPYSQMATATAYSAKDKNGQPIRTADGKLITGKTQAEADRNRFRYDMNHWVEANRRKTAHLPEGWRERIVTPDMNTFNAITGGVFNLTPIQVGRGVYNLSQGKDPGFILGNSGVVSEEYAQEHPWLALGANVLGEGLVGGFIYGAPKLYNAGVKNIRNYRMAKAFDKAVKESVLPEYKGNPYVDNPTNYISTVPQTNSVRKTSLKLLERPSKLTETERLGIPKGDRGNLNQSQLQAIEDLAQYRNSGQYRQTLKFTPDEQDYRWTYANAEGLPFLRVLAKRGKALRGPLGRMLTPDETGTLSYHIDKNAAGYSVKFPEPDGLKYSVGEANMFLDGNNQKLILTAPRTDFFSGPVIEDEALQAIGNSLPNTIDKEIMKNFWINARKAQRPGTYLSGDNGAPPLGSQLIQAYNSKKLHTHPYYERPIKEQLVIRDGLSPDSYSSIIRQGTRDGNLRWGEGFTRWNNSAVQNNYINQAYKDLMSGKITFDQYEKIFNAWSLNLGGKPLQYIIKGGIKRPVHPHPYIFAKKLGGKLITE